MFEHKILIIKIFGAMNDQKQWSRRYNFEIYQLFNKHDIVTNIKVHSIHDEHITKMLTKGQPVGYGGIRLKGIY